MSHEYEAKFAQVDCDTLRQTLTNAGYTQTYPERLMKRTSFHPTIPNPNKWARVRDEGDKITLTLKEIIADNDISGVKEAEVIVNDYAEAEGVLMMCDFKKVAYQETTREKWSKGDMEVVIDQWPGISHFCEVEGPSKEVVEAECANLGFDLADAYYGGVDVMYMHEHGPVAKAINTMPLVTFDNPPQF